MNKRFSHNRDVEDLPKRGATPLYYQQSGPDIFKSQYARFFGGSTLAGAVMSGLVPNDFMLAKCYQRDVDWPSSYNDLEPC